MRDNHLLFPFIILSFISHVAAQSVQIFGKFESYLTIIDAREIAQIYSSCFSGLGLLTCVPTLPTDDQVLSWQLPYLKDLGVVKGQLYCTECCSLDPSNIDIWDLYCPVDAGSRNSVNVYGYELRMATNSHSGDTGYVSCPLRRSACTYSSTGKTLSCNRAGDTTYLVGYKLTLTVQKYDQNFKYWRGVSGCEIEAIEANASLAVGESFHEYIELVHMPPTYPSYDSPKIAIVSVAILLLVYGALYFCRRKRCVYCQGKLVLSYSLCYKCYLVGAKPPDPVLLQALEEKGELLQGQLPERFPFARLLLASLRTLYMMVCCTCLLSTKVHPSAINQPLPYDTPFEQLEEAKEAVLDQVKRLKPSQQQGDKFQKILKKNPNLLDHHPRVIFEAIQHPKYVQDDQREKVQVIQQLSAKRRRFEEVLKRMEDEEDEEVEKAWEKPK